MDNTLEIDLKNKSAKLVLPFFNMTAEDSFLLSFMQNFSGTKDLIFTLEQGTLNVKIKYDFGKDIPDLLWEFHNSPLLKDTGSEFFTKEIILEYVKKILPSVQEQLGKMAEGFQKSAKILELGEDIIVSN